MQKSEKKQYFYSNGIEKLGPFTLEKLREEKISRETLVWHFGLEDWEKAESISELGDFFALVPPPIEKTTTNASRPIPREKNSFDILLFIALLYWFSTNFLNLIIQEVVEDWYDSPWKYVQIFSNIGFAIIPIVIALSIRQKGLKIAALIFGLLIAVYLLYFNIQWLIE